MADDSNSPRGRASREPPGPTTVPFVGNLIAFVRRPFAFREACATTYGDVVDISALGRPVYLVSHPETVERVLLDDHERFCKPSFEMQFVNDVFGRGLSFIEGDEWKRRRRILQPSFYRERLAAYADPMAVCARDLLADWEDGERIRLDEEMMRLTLRVLCETLFGLDIETDQPELVAAFRAVNDRHRLPQVLVPDWIPTATNRRYRDGVATLEAVIDEVIDRRRAGRPPSPNQPGGGEDGEQNRDLLAALLSATEDEDLTDATLRDELMGFLFAGHETTAMGLTFALTLLSENPQVRDRLQADLASAVDDDRPVAESLRGLSLLDGVVSEAVRLYPPSHSVARETTERMTLRGYEVPPGASLYLSQWVVHRDDRWWDEPETFDPGRWAGPTDRPDYAFFPFGGGPRQCIGRRFARLELRVALATMLLDCTVETHTTDPELEAGLTLRPANGIEATVRTHDA